MPERTVVWVAGMRSVSRSCFGRKASSSPVVIKRICDLSLFTICHLAGTSAKKKMTHDKKKPSYEGGLGTHPALRAESPGLLGPERDDRIDTGRAARGEIAR